MNRTKWLLETMHLIFVTSVDLSMRWDQTFRDILTEWVIEVSCAQQKYSLFKVANSWFSLVTFSYKEVTKCVWTAIQTYRNTHRHTTLLFLQEDCFIDSLTKKERRNVVYNACWSLQYEKTAGWAWDCHGSFYCNGTVQCQSLNHRTQSVKPWSHYTTFCLVLALA